MANYHVVPRGDATRHVTHGNACPCGPAPKVVSNDDSRGGYDTWLYHRHVSIEEAVMDDKHEVGAA